jgi:hypothetical protein
MTEKLMVMLDGEGDLFQVILRLGSRPVTMMRRANEKKQQQDR